MPRGVQTGHLYPWKSQLRKCPKRCHKALEYTLTTIISSVHAAQRQWRPIWMFYHVKIIFKCLVVSKRVIFRGFGTFPPEKTDFENVQNDATRRSNTPLIPFLGYVCLRWCHWRVIWKYPVKKHVFRGSGTIFPWKYPWKYWLRKCPKRRHGAPKYTLNTIVSAVHTVWQHWRVFWMFYHFIFVFRVSKKQLSPENTKCPKSVY